MDKVLVREVSPDLEVLHENPLLHRIYAARGITKAQELDYQLANLLSFEGLKGIEEAVDLLYEALTLQARILIVGDFDTDGATSVVLALLGLKNFGFRQVSYFIPSRVDHGYGLTAEVVPRLLLDKPELVITVDNGINSVEGVRLLKEQGVKVLVTDHHLPGENLPDAEAIIDPFQQGDTFASKALVGVGVVFYLLLAFRAYLRKKLDYQSGQLPNLAQFLDLVALGTIADAAVLDYNNRVLVANGLSRIRSGKTRLGIISLLKLAGRGYQEATSHDLGFVVAPRLNAAGRLSDMSLSVKILLSDDLSETTSLAKELITLNNRRKKIESKMQQEAVEILEGVIETSGQLPAGICIFRDSWHQGLVGIVASRIKEQYYRPTIVFAKDRLDKIRGSVRSVMQLPIREILEEISKKHLGLIESFGGHAMAAGVSLVESNYLEFAKVFAEEIAKRVESSDILGRVLYSDGELLAEHFTIEVAKLLRDSGPWGIGFEEPVFCNVFEVLQHQLLNEGKHLKLSLRYLGDKTVISAVYFNCKRVDFWSQDCSSIKAIYRLGINQYNGSCNLQLIISEIITYE